jgi:hypothetical protein
MEPKARLAIYGYSSLAKRAGANLGEAFQINRSSQKRVHRTAEVLAISF